MANINRVVLVGQPDARPRAAPHAERHGRAAACASPSTRAARTARPASGPRSRTTSTSPSGATRARAARSTSSKGRPVAIDGRLEWREWEAQDGDEAAGGRDRRRHRAVPRRPRRRRRRGGGGNQFVPAGATAGADADFAAASRRRHSVLRRGFGSTEDRSQSGRGRKRTAPTGRGRRKSCFFCKSKVDEIDYKNIAELRRYVSEKGKIRSRRISGACRRHQRQVAVAVKRAREMALLPYVTSGRRDVARDRGDGQ